MTAHLNHHHARVLEQIFAHPLPRNLEWPDVLSLLGLHKDVDQAEITELRHFLTEAGIRPTR